MTGPDIHSDDCYRVLGLDKSASVDEIKRAYLTLVREHTPERAPEAFKRIRQAYETLSDPTKRGEYDTRLDPRISQLLNNAAEAMQHQEFARAEQLYKQVLLESPDLSWVRNLLGICFLHQNRPLDAIAQLERVLQQPAVDPSMHANLAHAYAMVHRYDDAEKEFKIAMSLAGDRGFEYGRALIEMIADRGQVDAADRLAQELVKAVPTGSIAAAAYYSEQIELALRLNRRPTIPAILLQMTRGLETDANKRIAADMLGNLSGRLIISELFDIAEQVAKAGAGLHPGDPGLDALVQAGHLLHNNDFDGVTRLLRTHVSFAPGGAVQGLRPGIEHYVATHAVYKGMRPLASPPWFFRMWGIGSTLLHDERDYDTQTKTYVVTRCFTFFFVPLFPIANYRVRSTHNARLFLGRVALRRAQKVHLGVAAGIILFLLILASVNGSSDSDQAGATRLAGSTEHPDSNPQAQMADTAGITRYDGEIANTSLSITPVRAQLRFTIADSSATGYLAIYPPLSGSGTYTLRARGNEIRLFAVAGPDTIMFTGTRLGERTIAGTFALEGAMMFKRYGTWRMHLVSGAGLPQRLNPW
jgi:tetratricopeptide (TPR) repeat protein